MRWASNTTLHNFSTLCQPNTGECTYFVKSSVRMSEVASTGIMNARAIARHYAMLAGHGMVDGTRILSAERIDVIRALQTDAPDELSGLPVRRALGYVLAGEGGICATGAFGHGGYGGSWGFADPERKLGFGLTKNLMKPWLEPAQSAANLVAAAIRQHLDARI